MNRSIAGLRWFGIGFLLLLTCGRSAAQCGPSNTCPTVTRVGLYDIPNIPNTTIPLFFGGEGAGIALDPTNQLLYFGENPFDQGFAAVVQLDLTGKQGPVILQPPGGFGDVTALTFFGGKLYVADGNGYQNSFAAGQPTPLNVVWQYDPANTASNGGWSQVVTGVNDPTGLAFDATQNLYVSSWTDRTVYKYAYDSASGLYDIARVAFWTAPDPTAAPYGLAFDQVGNLYIAGFGGGAYSAGTKIFKVDSSGNSSIFFDAQAADPQSIYFNDGGSWQIPTAVAFDMHGYLYASYYNSLKIVRIAPDGSFIVVPGGGTGDDAANGIAISPQGDLFTVVNGGRTTVSPAALKIDGLVPVPPAVSLTIPQPTEVYQSTFLVSAATNASTIPTITATGACTVSGNSVTMISGTGTCTLTASWPADTKYLAATTIQTITAASAASSTALNSSFNPALLGQSVTFTAVVSSAIPGIPTGSMTFYNGGTALGSSPLSGAQASLTTAALSLGTHSITASYSGDANYAGSTSAALVQSIASSLPSVVLLTINETINTGDSESFPDIADSEAIKVGDVVTVTPLINVAAPVVSYSAGSLGFGSVSAGQTGMQLLSVSDIGQAPLTISSSVLSQGSAFAISQIACSNGAMSLPTTLPVGGACTFVVSYSAPTGAAASATMTFTDNAALSNLPTTPLGSSYTQSISLNGSGTSAPPPPPPPAVISVTDNEMIAVSEVESFPDVATSESIKVTDAVAVSVYNTSVGTNVVVTPVDSTTGLTPVTVTFASIVKAGSTTLTTSSGAATAAPAGFGPGNPPVIYNISTTATFTGSATVCINYAGTKFTGAPHLFHYENGSWVDRTTSVTSTTACAGVTSFSPFGLFSSLVPLTITANNATRLYGAPDPAFTATYSGFVNGDTPAVLSGTLKCTSTDTTASSVGSYAINCSGLSSPNYVIRYVAGLLTVTPASTTTSVSVSPSPVKYSDYTALTATVSPTSAGGQALTGNVQFSLNGGTVGSAVPINSSGVAALSQVQINWSAGSYPVTAVFTSANANFAGSTGTTSQIVTQENAFILYSGDTIAQVGTALNLRATVWDSAAAGYPGVNPETGPSATIGDITKMWIAFDIYPAGSCGSGTPSTLYARVALTSTAGVGTAASTLNSTSEASYCVVSRLVAGNTGGTNLFYTAPNAEVAGLDFYVNSGQFATGGGWVNDPTGSHGNFGFNARYNSTGSPKGQMVYVYRALYNGVLADFIIKSNALTALQFTGTTYPISSTLQGKVSVQVNRASDGLSLFSAGNYTFSATVTDSGQSGDSGKQFSLIVYNSSGVPYHQVASNTPLQGGNVVVHPH
jgi:hypothetical protein